MAEPRDLAAYYRAHREAFCLAQELGCTPREAERILRQRARARRAACGRVAADPAGDEPISEANEGLPVGDFADWSAPWMMRD